MKNVLAAFALILPLAALSAVGCRSTEARSFIPSRSCLDMTGEAYARCNNREVERLENEHRYREAAESIRGLRTIKPRNCVPNGYGGFECK